MGGSVKAPAPDPALQQAQIDSLTAQGELGRRQLNMTERMAPIQMDQMQFGLDASKTAYEQTQADRQYALGKRDQYDKAVEGVLAEGDKFDEATRRQELMQQAKADISMQFSGAQDQLQRGLNRAGVMPGSGKALLMQQAGELAEASAKSRAGLMVSEAAKKEGLQLKGQNAAMLAGAPAAAASLTPTGANLGVMGLDAANTGAGGMSQGFTDAASAVGAYGKSAGDMYSSQSKLYNDAQSYNNKLGNEVIGTAAGAAGSAAYKGKNNYDWNGSVWDSNRKGTNQNNLGW
jgi:hypothetical protein